MFCIRRLSITTPRIVNAYTITFDNITGFRKRLLAPRFATCSMPSANASTSRRGPISRRSNRNGSNPGTSRRSGDERSSNNNEQPGNGGNTPGVMQQKTRDIDDIVIPVKVPGRTPVRNQDDIGAELCGPLKQEIILKVLNGFPRRPAIRQLCEERGLTDRLFHQAFISFRQFCLTSAVLPVDLHVVISDVAQGNAQVDDLLPYFMKHAWEVFPHLECMDDLKQISDLRLPHNWYAEARSVQRKIIFHAGPTNSGKTYSALERFMNSKSGVYCGPLKLLASEVYHKTNNAGVPCDLITGEERQYASESKRPGSHIACTVEMLSVATPYEVAVIDEIQMLRDVQRGWAWTRALLGVVAEEVHVCGEPAAIDLIRELLYPIGEELELRTYKRMTPLKVMDTAVDNFGNVQPGDCIVAFSKKDIFNISRQIERRNVEVAVIYGGLPPGTKLAQAQKFNDPNNSCKVMVATDAIGMGLNLSIRRIIFYSLIKPGLAETGEKEMELLPTYLALQIAGRAGRYNTAFEKGEVTTFYRDDLPKLKRILQEPVGDIEKAGLHPTIEQIEMFAYYLPKATLSNLIDIFVSVCKVDESKYFMCNMDDFKFLADMIQHVSLSLRERYVFCLAPLNRKQPFTCGMFLRFARQFSRGEPLTWEWLCGCLGWPFSPPENIVDLMHLEGVFDVMDMYLWLGYRFVDRFPDMELVREMQRELDCIIQEGVFNITKLLKNTESPTSSGLSSADPDYQDFTSKSKREAYMRSSSRNTSEKNESGNVAKEVLEESFDDAGTNEKVRLGQGTLTRRLIDQGIITFEMWEKLQQEFLTNRKRKSDPPKDT